MDTNVHNFQFDNGLVLLCEEMTWSESFAIGISVPAGTMWEEDRLAGLASLTCEMTNRGAGEFDNRSFLETMENLGVRSSENASKRFAFFSATGLCDNWERTLELLALQIRAPRFPEDEFEACRQIQLQEIAAEEDDPDRKTSIAFNNIFLPKQFARPTIGTKETINNITLEDVHNFHQNVYRPNETIIAIAGRVKWDEVKEKVDELFGDWNIIQLQPRDSQPVDQSVIHIPSNTSQTTIQLGYVDVPCNVPDYLNSLGGIKVLSGGLSSRLFTEVREKRGLCYGVYAVHNSLGNFGYVVCGCGTKAESSQQSLDVIISELDRLSTEPITQSELERVKIRIKSSLVMQGESTAQRVAVMTSDWRYFNRIIPFAENMSKINSLSCKSIESYYANHPQRKFRLATSGPQPLEISNDRLF